MAALLAGFTAIVHPAATAAPVPEVAVPGDPGGRGERATARVVLNGNPQPEMRPNQLGVFPRHPLPASIPVDLEVSYPDAPAGAKIVVAVQDGGRLANGQAVQVLTADASKKAPLRFTPGNNRGLYRVTVRRGMDVKTLEFWVGPELPLTPPNRRPPKR